jgi:serine/threonine protein kinase/Tol biopolymer transport system component
MGEVYRAHDTRLGRDVAIKVLASHLSSSPELKQRMEREARAISALNHPHICHLYDIGSHDGTDFLVMEFFEGETLAARLRKGPLPLAEIFKIGIAIADALAIAHRQGIVHRDLKPGNIMLTPAGAKLMDFGLAKPLNLHAGAGSSSSLPSFTAAATLSGPSPLTPLTSAGTIIGTIQYMSPEQIEGKEADARCDIFALGAVLYEMATGERPFEGKSQISLASAILESTPPAISTVVPLAPPAFEHVVATCLQKNPEQRFQTAHDVKLELQWIASGSSSAVGPIAVPHTSRSRPLIWAAALVVAVAAGVLAGFFMRPSSPALPSIRTVINPPEKTTVNLTGDFAGPPVLSPDGKSVAFTAAGSDGKSQIWVRPLNKLEAHELPDTMGAFFPFWSPDSRSLAFFADGKLKTVDLEGGSAQTVCDVALGRGGAWSAGSVILFSPNPSAPLFQVNASGGTPVPLTKLDVEKHTSHRFPFFLPDGKHFLYVAINHDASKSANDAVYYASLDGTENKLLFHSQSNAIYADGFLLFARGDELLAQPFDPVKGSLGGEPHSVATGVMNDVSTWHMDASASNGGVLVFGTGGNADLQLVWMDRATKQVTSIADKLGDVEAAAISPQGDRVALQVNSGENDIWSLDLARGVRTRLTFGPVANNTPVWSPDGKWIAYSSLRNSKWAILRKPSDGSGTEELLLSDDQQIIPTDWSHDGKYLIYMRAAPPVQYEVMALPLQGERKPIVLVRVGGMGKLSPDGRWLAYMSKESGNLEVYVVPFGGGQGKWQVSASGGLRPSWSGDGKELYYADPVFNVYAVPVKVVGDALQFGTPRGWVTGWSTPPVFFYDVAPGSKKILLDRVSQQVNQSITVVSNFTEGLR